MPLVTYINPVRGTSVAYPQPLDPLSISSKLLALWSFKELLSDKLDLLEPDTQEHDRLKEELQAVTQLLA